MACPMGYTSSTHPSASSPLEVEKPPIFPPIVPPSQLRAIGADAIFLLGGQFVILCQFAHPALAEGSFTHSTFAARVLDRLKTTARFMNAAVYGSASDKAAIFGVIHARHASVRGPGYSADDLELHKWTAATLFFSIVKLHEAFLGPVSQQRQDALYRECAVYGTSLRMPPEMWPPTLEAFWTYWDHNMATLEVTDWARSLARDLLWPRDMPVWVRPGVPVARLLTVYWLPELLRRELGLQELVTPRNTRVYRCVVGGTRVMYPLVPRVLKEWPSRYYMKDLKRAVKTIEETGDWKTEKERRKGGG